jgi:hypothetical protein
MTTAGLRALIKHLYNLYALGTSFTGVLKEIDTISSLLADWVIDSEDRMAQADDRGDQAGVDRYQHRIDLLNEASEVLGERNPTNKGIMTAIHLLEEVLRG